MLANSGSNISAFWADPIGHNPEVETLLNDVAKQVAASNLTRRLSRGSAGQKGGSMRIVKTASANISPRNSTMLNRRKTLTSESPYRRRAMMFDQNGMADGVSNGLHVGVRQQLQANRPVSWHSSSHMAPRYAPQSSSAYPISNYEHYETMNTQAFPPTPAIFSGYASPASTFSPLSLPFTDYRQQPFQYTEDSFFHNSFDQSTNMYSSYQSSAIGDPSDTQGFGNADNMDPAMYSHFDWDNFAANGFDTTTAPPTPENFLPIQQPDPSFEAEEAIPYHPLEESEPGEVLVGMGLYDAPEKSPALDPQLDNYRAAMMSQLLGPAYRKQETPSAGKGLKLEETWNPPASSDEDDDDDDEDAEGSDSEENAEEPANVPNINSVTNNNTTTYTNRGLVQDGNGLKYGQTGWL